MNETLHELEDIRRNVMSMMLELDAIIGEVRLRLAGLEEAARVAVALEDSLLPAGWRVVDGQVVYSAGWLDRQVAS